MYLLQSVHGLGEVTIRFYPTKDVALADQLNWRPANSDSEFLGFKLTEFGDDAQRIAETFFESASPSLHLTFPTRSDRESAIVR
jgi:hypothetical protein